MKKLWKIISALMLCGAIVISVSPRVKAADVYFMAVNDTLLDLNSFDMPTLINGTVYVPYTMLSTSSTGVNLGVWATYSPVNNSVLVYSNRSQLIFDMAAGVTYDSNGQYYSEQAVLRNSAVYIPIVRVCSVFSEISCSVMSTSYGSMVRVCSSNAVLGDEAFVSAAENMMRSALTSYEQANQEQEIPREPDPEPSMEPDVELDPESEEDVPGIGSDAAVYLGFLQGDEGNLAAAASILEAQNRQGIFFLTADQMIQQDDYVRELIGRGQFIGLCPTSDSEEEILKEVEQAQSALSAVAHCRLSVVLADGFSEECIEQVEEKGCVCWFTTADGLDLEGSNVSSQVDDLVGQLMGGESSRNYVLLPSDFSDVLVPLLNVLGQEEFQVRAPVAPEIGKAGTE